MALLQLDEEQVRTWTLEQKDRWWFENVWRGDMPQLTLRSAVTGFLLGGGASLNNGITVTSFLYSLLGAVILLAIVVDIEGRTRDIRVLRPLPDRIASHPPTGLAPKRNGAGRQANPVR